MKLYRQDQINLENKLFYEKKRLQKFEKENPGKI